MLTIKTSKNELNFHVGQVVPDNVIVDTQFIWVDGHEYDKIIRVMPMLAMNSFYMRRYIGVFAQQAVIAFNSRESGEN